MGSFGSLADGPASLLATGARVIDPSDGSDAVRDLAVVDGLIASPDAVPGDATRIDARGLVLVPGFCDLHVHLRDPGDAGTESIRSGTRAAARGGFTTVCAMPNTDPPLDDAEAVRDVIERAADAACRVRVIGAATIARAGSEIADLERMVDAGAVGFSDDGAAVPTDVAASVIERLAALDVPLFEHAEDPALAGAGVMRAGPAAVRLGLAGWDEAAEVAVVERDLALAETVSARVHLTHLSSPRSLAAIVSARERGVRVTCDVTPHHLALTERWIAGDRRFAWEEADDPPGPLSAAAYDGTCRVNPPLTTAIDARTLLAGVDDGRVDAIATDHAPHPSHRKLVPFDEAAPGLIGLETALSIGLAAVEAGRLALPALVAALSTRPAAVIGEERGLGIGRPADLVLFDPDERWRVEPDRLASASHNTPLLGLELPGVVRLTIANGRVTYRS